jgi:hypothetical protein
MRGKAVDRGSQVQRFRVQRFSGSEFQRIKITLNVEPRTSEPISL